MKKRKIDYAQPKTIEEAINDLQEFLECDLYSKFRPAHTLPLGKNGKDETWYRQDVFESERDFIKYLEDHFNIFKKEVKKLINKKDGLSKKNKR